MSNPFRYFNSSPEIIRLAVLMYVKYPLSLRNVEDLLAERGIDISHETVRFWWNRFGPMFAAEIRKKRLAHMRGYPQKTSPSWSDSAPEIAELAVDLHERLIQMPPPMVSRCALASAWKVCTASGIAAASDFGITPCAVAWVQIAEAVAGRIWNSASASAGTPARNRA